MQPYLYTQTELLASIRTLLMESTADRWTDSNIYAAMSMALQSWQGRVRTPYTYTVPGGWIAGTYDYTLPSYIESKTIQPQAKRLLYDYLESGEGDETWFDINAYEIEPSDSGAMVLRLHYGQSRYDVVGASTEGRIIHWAAPGSVPTTPPTLSAGIDADDTSLTIASKPSIGRVGYTKIDDEWVGYAGYTEGDTTFTLTNLQRGLNGTTAASHSLGASAIWGVAVETDALVNQLISQTMYTLMKMYLMNPSSYEAGQYEKLLGLMEREVDKFWRGWRPSRPMRMRLSRMAIGDNL
jgi:hypothetical protein